MQLHTSRGPQDLSGTTRPQLPTIRQREEEPKKHLQLPVIYLDAAEAVINFFVVPTVALERVLTAMGIEKVKQWFPEGKVKN